VIVHAKKIDVEHHDEETDPAYAIDLDTIVTGIDLQFLSPCYHNSQEFSSYARLVYIHASINGVNRDIGPIYSML
jgi:hypothetical protein